MNRPTRRAAAAATRVPTVHTTTGGERPRLTVEGCDVRAEIGAIIGAWPARETMPTEPTSGLCGYEWWARLPYRRGEGPGLHCTLPAGHPGTHQAVGRDGHVYATHDPVDHVEVTP